MQLVRWLCGSLLILLVVTSNTQAQVGHVVQVQMPIAPSAVPAEGQIHLVYEVHVTNLQSENTATLTGLQAIATEIERTLAALEGEELVRDIRIVGAQDVSATEDGVELKAGTRAIVYMWVSLEPGSEPTSITHRIRLFRVLSEGETEHHEFDTEPLGLGPAPVVISPPVGGDWWVVDGRGRRQDNTGHRRAAQISVRGRAPIAQRFARDLVRIVDGRALREGREGNAGSYGWGREVLAVADGVVVDIQDTIPENHPGAPGLPKFTLKTLLGNHVVLDIGEGRYAVYGHLQPGQMRVTVGDRVRPGDVLALVGNSGASGGPHLHFQITDNPSPLGGEGLPYVIDRFEVSGRKVGFQGVPESWDPQRREREMPMENAILRFLVR